MHLAIDRMGKKITYDYPEVAILDVPWPKEFG